MRFYIGVVCCIILLCNGAKATSSASASLSMSVVAGRGGSSVKMDSHSRATGNNAASLIHSNGAAHTRNSEAAVQHSSVASSHEPSGRTDVLTDTKAHTIGRGKVHGKVDAEAANHYSDARLGHEAVVQSNHGGAAAADIKGVANSDDYGSEAGVSNVVGSVNRGSVAVTNDVETSNGGGYLSGSQHVAAGSDRGGESNAEVGIVGYQDHHRSGLESVLKAFTEGSAAALAGSQGVAVGSDRVASAAKLNLDVQSSGERRRSNRKDSSRSLGYIFGSSKGGKKHAETHADAEGEVYKDGAVGATAEIGAITDDDDSVIEAGIAINADGPQPVVHASRDAPHNPHPRPIPQNLPSRRSHHRTNRRRGSRCSSRRNNKRCRSRH